MDEVRERSGGGDHLGAGGRRGSRRHLVRRFGCSRRRWLSDRGRVMGSTCGGAGIDTMSCDSPQRTLLAFGGPLILFAAGFRAYLLRLARPGYLVVLATAPAGFC